MDDRGIEAALESAERAIGSGSGLAGTGFWPAVARVRADRALAERYADRIGAIDRRAFERGVRPRVPAWLGLLALAAGTAAGAGCLVATAYTDGLLQTLLFLAGFFALLVFTHVPAHWLVGRMVGIRFTHVFLGGPPPPRPGIKTDYATYLRTPARKRALMHASGAVLTKLVPFALIPLALAVDAWDGVLWILIGLGLAQILTDVVLSTKTSDWMKVRREFAAARR